eukprot:Trichotokara_eunicae@DN6204_c0_g1_i10.p1
MMGMWRYPACSIHGIQGDFNESGFKTVIPSKVTGRFSVRTVPDMTLEGTPKRVLAHLNDVWAKRGSTNDFTATHLGTGPWWVADPENSNYAAAARATVKVTGVEPDLIREGGSIPVSLVFSEATGKDVCLLPIGRSDDGAHGMDEKINRSNYITGTKTMAAYYSELAQN